MNLHSFLLIALFALVGESAVAKSYLIRKIVLRDNESFSDEQLRRGMRIEVGKTYSNVQLKEDFDRIVGFYHKNGFSFARIDENLSLKKEFSDGLYLHIYVDEGRVGKITVEGNTRTRDHVILRELLLNVGGVYTVEDELESERILRRKPYLGSAEIESTWDAETSTVQIRIVVTDLWTVIPAIDLPAFNRNSSDFLAKIEDSNVFGSGNHARFRYQRLSESGERTRSLIRSRYSESRLFGSHWQFHGLYTQKREGDSWEVRLNRPQYSLKTRWSAAFKAAEPVDLIRWYDGGRKTDTFDRRVQLSSGKVTRFFGNRRQQTQLTLWLYSKRTKFTLLENLTPSDANLQNRNIKMLGVSLGRRTVDFVRTRYVNEMGRVEDLPVGQEYRLSVGYGSPIYGSDQSEAELNLLLYLSFAHREFFLLHVRTDLTTRFTPGPNDSVLNGNIKLVRKNLLFQTLAARLSTVFEFGLDGESQVHLGGLSGLRGYGPRQFSGEKMMVLNIESRTIFRGGLFRKLESVLVVGSSLFVDIGYIWNGKTFHLRKSKRSIGVGLRFSIPKLGGSRIYRLDLSCPLDTPGASLSAPVLTYGIGHIF